MLNQMPWDAGSRSGTGSRLSLKKICDRCQNGINKKFPRRSSRGGKGRRRSEINTKLGNGRRRKEPPPRGLKKEKVVCPAREGH